MTPGVKAAIFGASGYAGGELLRLLLDHPRAEPVAVISRSQAGQPVSNVHAHLSRLTDLEFVSELPRGADEPEVIFLAGSNGYAAEIAPALLDTGIPVVDLSADFRLKDPASFEKFYGPPPPAFARRNEWVYGLPELFRDQIASSRAVASPGCFATAAILALAPLWRENLVAEGGGSPPVSVFAITGSSGAGVSPSPTTHHPRRASAFFAYQIEGHRHLPEIEESLSAVG
ncbi:MAG TPA: N-acetyl-gamma-glutamyl-phosphate reductase, partial [Thermoanaerobaculia bacterium]|nr:N-acetyl-gamma-glutamyl-phosphate reductase [Thermoanaerobaculia bacterium]